MVKHTPATPLPWSATRNAVIPRVFGAECGLRGSSAQACSPERTKDAAYIAHAANAYPKLVEALRRVTKPMDSVPGAAGMSCRDVGYVGPSETEIDTARALLRELGEDA